MRSWVFDLKYLLVLVFVLFYCKLLVCLSQPAVNLLLACLFRVLCCGVCWVAWVLVWGVVDIQLDSIQFVVSSTFHCCVFLSGACCGFHIRLVFSIVMVVFCVLGGCFVGC